MYLLIKYTYCTQVRKQSNKAIHLSKQTSYWTLSVVLQLPSQRNDRDTQNLSIRLDLYWHSSQSAGLCHPLHSQSLLRLLSLSSRSASASARAAWGSAFFAPAADKLPPVAGRSKWTWRRIKMAAYLQGEKLDDNLGMHWWNASLESSSDRLRPSSSRTWDTTASLWSEWRVSGTHKRMILVFFYSSELTFSHLADALIQSDLQ